MVNDPLYPKIGPYGGILSWATCIYGHEGSTENVEKHESRERLLAEDPLRRFVLLNTLVSRPRSRNRDGSEPPIDDGDALLKIIRARVRDKVAIEFEAEDKDSDADDAERIRKNAGKNYLRLRNMRFPQTDNNSPRYVTMLFEYWDSNRKNFHVADPETFQGRSLAGNGNERGVVSAYMIVRLPSAGAFNDGRYRCVVEVMPAITRRVIEHFLCRQLRRVSDREEWTFEVEKTGSKGKVQRTQYRYTPALELHGDVGRRLDGEARRIMTGMTFTKRAERHRIGDTTDVQQRDFTADVRAQVSLTQAPDDPAERRSWVDRVKDQYLKRGYTVTYSWRNPAGDMFSGAVHSTLDGAADIVMCRREIVTFPAAREAWEPDLDNGVINALKAVLDKDELWERPV